MTSIYIHQRSIGYYLPATVNGVKVFNGNPRTKDWPKAGPGYKPFGPLPHNNFSNLPEGFIEP